MVKDRQRKPARVSGQWPALALAIAVHVVFIAVLVFSLRWQNRKPEPITAELYAPPAKSAVAEPAETKPTPPPPPPPKAVSKPEPKTEKPDVRADIARKAKEEEERTKRERALREKQEREK